MQPEHEDVDEARDNRGDGEGQINERDEERLAAELKLGDAPRRGDAEEDVQRHGDGGHEEREFDGGDGVRLTQRAEVGVPALAQRLREDIDQRQQQEDAEEERRDRDEDPFYKG